MAVQLALDLGLPAVPRETVVSRCNEAAYGLVSSWPGWPARIVAVHGPRGSGRSHLAAAFAERSGGVLVRGVDLAARDVLDLGRGVTALDDADGADDRALFHLINAVHSEGGALLMTAERRRMVALADLASRLRAVPEVMLAAPDDALLRQVMVDAFAKRQLAPKAEVLDFLLSRIERTLHGVMDIVALIDNESLRAGGAPSRPLAARVLRQVTCRTA